jgi:anti-anti-sigma factor
MFHLILKPEGDLVDFHSWDSFAEILSKMVQLTPENVILDLVHVNRMSSNYIGTIISNHKTASENNKTLTLVNVRPKMFELLEMLKLHEVINVERIEE